MEHIDKETLLTQIREAIQMYGPLNAVRISFLLKLRNILISAKAVDDLLNSTSTDQLRSFGIAMSDVTGHWTRY